MEKGECNSKQLKMFVDENQYIPFENHDIAEGKVERIVPLSVSFLKPNELPVFTKAMIDGVSLCEENSLKVLDYINILVYNNEKKYHEEIFKYVAEKIIFSQDINEKDTRYIFQNLLQYCDKKEVHKIHSYLLSLEHDNERVFNIINEFFV